MMAFMMYKLAMINSCEITLEKLKKNFAKNHCEIQVRTILVVHHTRKSSVFCINQRGIMPLHLCINTLLCVLINQF
jgi:hypothetical protein